MYKCHNRDEMDLLDVVWYTLSFIGLLGCVYQVFYSNTTVTVEINASSTAVAVVCKDEDLILDRSARHGSNVRLITYVHRLA